MVLKVITIIVALIILSLKTGIVLSTCYNKKLPIVLITAIIGASMLLIIFMITPYIQKIGMIIDRYTFGVSLIAAVLLFYLGAWDHNQSKNNRIIALIPCPFCLLAVAALIIFFIKDFSICNFSVIATAFVITYQILILLFTYLAKVIFKKYGKIPEDYLNPFLMVSGLVTIISALFIPNYIRAARMSFSPVIIESGKVLMCSIAVLGFAAIAGYIKEIGFGKSERSM